MPAYFMGIALAVRARANCRGSRVGAVIARDDRIVSTGYNGTPSGMTNCLEGGCLRCARPERYGPGEAYDLCICVHAEQNALLAAARFGIEVQGATLYTTMQPCFGCAKELLQARDRRHPLPAPVGAGGPGEAGRVPEAPRRLRRERAPPPARRSGRGVGREPHARTSRGRRRRPPAAVAGTPHLPRLVGRRPLSGAPEARRAGG
jgi:tRNA(Arg) A34 adenosine deaminase TadA